MTLSPNRDGEGPAGRGGTTAAFFSSSVAGIGAAGVTFALEGRRTGGGALGCAAGAGLRAGRIPGGKVSVRETGLAPRGTGSGEGDAGVRRGVGVRGAPDTAVGPGARATGGTAAGAAVAGRRTGGGGATFGAVGRLVGAGARGLGTSSVLHSAQRVEEGGLNRSHEGQTTPSVDSNNADIRSDVRGLDGRRVKARKPP